MPSGLKIIITIKMMPKTKALIARRVKLAGQIRPGDADDGDETRPLAQAAQFERECLQDVDIEQRDDGCADDYARNTAQSAENDHDQDADGGR